MISIIIPAHNEENVISKTLKTLLEGTIPGQIEIVVVCNGCTDKTVKIVSSFVPAIKLILTDIPSKANALNLGDALATGFPRFYQDADVLMTTNSIKNIATLMSDERFLAAAPRMEIDLSKSSWAVKAYYEVWQQLPYIQEGMIGAGVYALSEEGRRRFKHFPQIISDDGFVRALFQTSERVVVSSCKSVVRAPTNLRGLIKIKTRSRLGSYQLMQKFPELANKHINNPTEAIKEIAKKPAWWAKALVYLLVNLASRVRAHLLYQQKNFTLWERDNSSRRI